MKKRNPLVPRQKLFKGVQQIGTEHFNGAEDDLLEFIAGMGYLIYENPTSEYFLFISSRRLTYRDLKRMAKRFGIDLNWWDNATELNDHLDEELEEYKW